MTPQDQNTTTKATLVQSLSPTQKALAAVAWAAICTLSFFLFKEMDINLAAALLVVSLFGLGLATVGPITRPATAPTTRRTTNTH